MAINIPKNNSRRGRGRLMSEINVTPMVDVMLVLLIIFMVTSPMLVAGVEVDLPETKSSPISGQDTPLVISIKKEGDIFITETKTPFSELATKLKNITKEKKDTRIFVKGDKNVPYGKIVETMAEIHNAGFTKVALISDIKHK
ncbi:MAG: protein TolR [Alphaproteobacteria bacterium]|jgi:biopolymer transport protein TolR|nr:protein TolR [Alphaproteobacteria bacterium]